MIKEGYLIFYKKYVIINYKIKRNERDLVKNQFCLSNNYILIRIPYDKINTLTLEDLMGDKYKIYE